MVRGLRVSWAHATRDLSKASDADLTAMHNAADALMKHQRSISPRVLTELCLIREETFFELQKRTQATRDKSFVEPAARPA